MAKGRRKREPSLPRVSILTREQEQHNPNGIEVRDLASGRVYEAKTQSNSAVARLKAPDDNLAEVASMESLEYLARFIRAKIVSKGRPTSSSYEPVHYASSGSNRLALTPHVQQDLEDYRLIDKTLEPDERRIITYLTDNYTGDRPITPQQIGFLFTGRKTEQWNRGFTQGALLMFSNKLAGAFKKLEREREITQYVRQLEYELTGIKKYDKSA